MWTRLNVSVRSRSNWNLEMLVFEERGKPEYKRKTSRSKGENQQQTQPTYGVDAAIRTQATAPPLLPYLPSLVTKPLLMSHLSYAQG